MVPRQPDVDYEDSVTTEQRAALEKESDARQHYKLRVDNFGEQSQQRGGKSWKDTLGRSCRRIWQFTLEILNTQQQCRRTDYIWDKSHGVEHGKRTWSTLRTDSLWSSKIFYPTHPTLGYFVCFPFAGGLNGAKPSTFIYWYLFGGSSLMFTTWIPPDWRFRESPRHRYLPSTEGESLLWGVWWCKQWASWWDLSAQSCHATSSVCIYQCVRSAHNGLVKVNDERSWSVLVVWLEIKWIEKSGSTSPYGNYRF